MMAENMKVASAGESIVRTSVRPVLCLAFALLRKNKIVILAEHNIVKVSA